MTTDKIINNTLNCILESLKDKLSEIKTEEEVYFWDICTEEIDTNTPQDNKTALNLIEETGLLKYADYCLIDNSNLNRQLVTSAYCCLEQAIINKEIIQELQTDLNNENITKKKAQEIYKKIVKYQEENGLLKPKNKIKYEDTRTQIFINTGFSIGSLTKEDFIKYGLKDNQIIDLSNSLKFLTSNKSINQNALVIEEKKRSLEEKKFIFRVYLMEMDQDIDIRNLFKLQVISEETGFNLSPSAYIEQTTDRYEEDKKLNKKSYLSDFKDKIQFIKQIIRICNKLTERTI